MLDERKPEGMGLTFEIVEHPISVLLFIGVLPRIDVGGPMAQHVVDQPGALAGHRRDGLGGSPPGLHQAIVAPKAL